MKKTYFLSLLTIAASLGFVSLPAYADKNVTQIINQEINVVGNGNTINQSAVQTNVQTQSNNRKGKPGNLGNTDTYQELNQSADIRGNNNNVRMNAQQVNVSREGHRDRDHDRGHRGHKKDD
ncbi:hypothetical protein V2H45_15535 [Tumidithrix elongata RA019]|uniref:Uncharacterized protein n=1 Tax=Tumidithrix elongata BACA0141 TaxID=2716417 RepID=A0AAW9PV26_9CYAN|nr:hypothetical protein [Tumidithrix elongata RA019]